jgi:hypothetical protein
MKIKYYISLAILLILNVCCLAQVETEIQGENIFELSVIQVFPDSFPQVDVIFLARDVAGRPLWEINEKDLIVLEDGNMCDILELTNISASEIIDIALVFDHSGSMGYLALPDSMYNYDWSQKQSDSLMLLTKPIDFAKTGMLSFISSVELKSDSILIAGFSSRTDSIVGPTQDSSILKAKVHSMNADNGTAFYDALTETMSRLSEKGNQRSAIVSLTDGQDNESEKSVEDVIIMSNELDIPIYVIGLGNVQDSTLMKISESTNGLYYKTEDPSRLQEIYMNISRQLKSVYKLTYASSINGFTDDEHTLTFRFKNDTIKFSNPDIRLTLPKEVVTYIHKQEQSRIETQRNRNLIFGGIAVGILAIGLMTFVLYRKKNRRTLRINNLYPNPFTGVLNVSIESNIIAEEFDVEIVNLRGDVVHKFKSRDKENRIDLSHLPRDIYVISVTSADGAMDSAKTIKK